MHKSHTVTNVDDAPLLKTREQPINTGNDDIDSCFNTTQYGGLAETKENEDGFNPDL